MLSMQVLKSARGAADYYLEAVNYYKDDATAMRWLGKGAVHLDLGEQVEHEQLLSLLNGELPDGQVLGKVEINKETGEKIRNHRPGLDMTFSAPKSVSVLIGLDKSYSDFFLNAHDKAVEWALTQVESAYAATRKKEGGKIEYVSTGNLTIAACRHPTSRANDPNTHTHALVMNLTFDESGKASSLASDMFGNRGVIEAIGKNQVYIGALYRYKLAEKLINAGFTLELTKDGLFEIAGFPKEVLAEFSKRRDEILAFIDEHGLSGSKAKDYAALATRDGKTERPLDELVKEWCIVVEELGHDPLSLIDSIKKSADKALSNSKYEQLKSSIYEKIFGKDKSEVALDTAYASNAIQFAANSISNTKEVFSNYELKAKAIEYLIGQNKIIDLNLLDKEISRLGMAQEFIIHDSEIEKEQKIATRKSIETAKKAIDIILDEKKSVTPICSAKEVITHTLNYNEKSRNKLTKSQSLAVSKILTSSDRIIAIQGYAGTGKTTMLKLSKEIAELKLSNDIASDKGYELKGITIATTARNELIKKAHIDADVYDAAINKIKATNKDLSKTIFIVDESSMISSAQALELVELIKEKNARLIFVGDRAQLKSVNEGRFFEMAQIYGMDTSEMTEIIRQTNPRQLEAAQHASRGEIYDAINKLDRVSELDTHEKRVAFFAQNYIDMSPIQRDKTLLFAAKHSTIRKITSQIRVGLQKDGTLTGEKYKHDILNRVKIDGDEAKLVPYYQAGNIIKFNDDIKKYNIKSGDYYTVAPITKQALSKNMLTLIREGGRKFTLPIDSIPLYSSSKRNIPKIELYSKSQIELQLNDKIVFTKSNNKASVANSDVGIIKAIDAEKISILTQDNEIRTFSKSSGVLKHINYGYVLTNYKVQGKDKFAGVAFIESSDSFACDLSNFYVQITRATFSMSLVTDNKIEVIKSIELNDNSKPSVFNFVKSIEFKELDEQAAYASNLSPIESKVINITEQREEAFKSEIIEPVTRYHQEKEKSVENQQLELISELAYKIASSPESYKYAQRKLGYSYLTYQRDAFLAQANELSASLSAEEKVKLEHVSNYISSQQEVRNAIQALEDLKAEQNQSEAIKQQRFGELYLAKLNRNRTANTITQDIDAYQPYLKIYSIGELNRVGIPQYKYDEERVKSAARLDKLLDYSSEYDNYLNVLAYFKDEIDAGHRSQLAYDLLETKGALHAHVFHFADILNIERKALYNKLYTDANIHKESLFMDGLTINEQQCFKKVKAYRLACKNAANQWSEISKLINDKKSIPEAIQSAFNDISSSRAKLASEITGHKDFEKAIEYFDIDQSKLKTHESRYVKEEVVDGILSKGSYSLADKLHFASHIIKDFKGYYPIIKSHNGSIKTLHRYTNYITQKTLIESALPHQKPLFEKVKSYKLASKVASKAWKDVYRFKERKQNVPSEYIERAIRISAQRDYKASLISPDLISDDIAKAFKIMPDLLQKHSLNHNKKVNELYKLKDEQKALLAGLDASGMSFNKNEAEGFMSQWQAIIQAVKEKKDHQLSYQYALKAVPISLSSMTNKHKEIANKYDLKFNFNGKSANRFEHLNQDKKHTFYDLDTINDILKSDVISTYKAIFGEPKTINSSVMSYSGGLHVTLKGAKKGAWYDFTGLKGGWIIQAIEEARGVNTKEAINIAAEMASVLPSQGAFNNSFASQPNKNKNDISEDQYIKNRVKAANAIWDKTVPIEGTIGETYLKKHRGISDISKINVRFLPKGTRHFDVNSDNKTYTNTTKHPAIVFPATNQKEHIKGVQRVFLDQETGKKNGLLTHAKLSKGVTKGNAIIMQKGNNKNPVFIAEGPETAASIASAFPDCFVLATMGIHNIKNTKSILDKVNSKSIIIASDNDGKNGLNTDNQVIKSKEHLETNGFKVSIFKPSKIKSLDKTDWNDVIKHQGINKIHGAFIEKLLINNSDFDLSRMAPKLDINPILSTKLHPKINHNIANKALEYQNKNLDIEL